MALVVTVRFKDSGRTYYFDSVGFTLKQGDMVIVDTIHGPELAKVVYAEQQVDDAELVGELKPVLRRAEQCDFTCYTISKQQHDEIIAICQQKIEEHSLNMHLVKAEYNIHGSRLTFYFTANQRVDFRMLVRDLARTFKTRIELRQIGPRDEAKLLGGIGMCGRILCCTTFLPDYAKVTIKMAKDQDLPLNPTKISGVCNRLLCCLSYEHEQYLELKSALPHRGTHVQTPDGIGMVVALDALRQMVTVQLLNSGMQETYPLHNITLVKGTRYERQKNSNTSDNWQDNEFDEDGEHLSTDDYSLVDTLNDAPDTTHTIFKLLENDTLEHNDDSSWQRNTHTERRQTKRSQPKTTEPSTPSSSGVPPFECEPTIPQQPQRRANKRASTDVVPNANASPDVEPNSDTDTPRQQRTAANKQQHTPRRKKLPRQRHQTKSKPTDGS